MGGIFMKSVILNTLLLLAAPAAFAGNEPGQTEAERFELLSPIQLKERGGKAVYLKSMNDRYPGYTNQNVRMTFNETNSAHQNRLQLKIREPHTERVEFELGRVLTKADLRDLEVAASATGQNIGLKFSALPARPPVTDNVRDRQSCTRREYRRVCDRRHCWTEVVQVPGWRDVEFRRTTFFDEYELEFVSTEGNRLGRTEFNYNQSERQYLYVGSCY